MLKVKVKNRRFKNWQSRVGKEKHYQVILEISDDYEGDPVSSLLIDIVHCLEQTSFVGHAFSEHPEALERLGVKLRELLSELDEYRGICSTLNGPSHGYLSGDEQEGLMKRGDTCQANIKKIFA